MNVSCLLCGVGGQGTVLASRLIALAAMKNGQNVRTAETIGMAQRGGCVVSHVRIGEEIHSSLIPMYSADIIIAFEPAEAVRCLPYLKEGGFMIVNDKAIKPVTSSLSKTEYDGSKMLDFLKENVFNLRIIDGDAVCKACGSTKVLNIALLGAATMTGVLGLSMEEMKQAIIERVPEKYLEMNLKAFEAAI